MENNVKTKQPAPLRLVVVGCTPLARRAIDAIESLSCCELSGVVNLSIEQGRLKSNYDSFPDWATRRPSDILWTNDINSDEARAWIAMRRPDVLLQAGWSQIFKPDVLAIPARFCLGIHPAPLPRGRGGAVINWRLIEGGGPWGNSLFMMRPSVDSGDVLDTEPFMIEPRDDIRTAHLKVDRTAARMLSRTLPKIAAGHVTAIPQDSSLVTRYQRRRPDDGLIKATDTAEKWINYVRALTHPFPGAFIQTPLGNLTIWKAEVGLTDKATPGILLEISAGRGIRLSVSGGRSVWLTLVTPPNDLECWADEWAIERGLAIGTTIVL